MGMFRDMRKLSTQAKDLNKSTQKPKTGDMIKQASEQLGNLDIDLEVHVGSRAPYRVRNQYMVPHAAQIAVGTELPIKVDREDPAKIVIDWESVEERPAYGEIRPA